MPTSTTSFLKERRLWLARGWRRGSKTLEQENHRSNDKRYSLSYLLQGKAEQLQECTLARQCVGNSWPEPWISPRCLLLFTCWWKAWTRIQGRRLGRLSVVRSSLRADRSEVWPAQPSRPPTTSTKVCETAAGARPGRDSAPWALGTRTRLADGRARAAT